MYYRFHKPVGKGVWRAYTERYAKPRELEAKQRLVFACQPTYKQYKRSVSWLWRLPKGLDGATTPNAVLRAFQHFQHKQPKRIYFYMHLLQRLTQTNFHSPGDKRLKQFVNYFHAKRKNVLNKPRLALLFAKLRLYKNLDYLGRLMKSGIPSYSPAQLTSLAQAYGLARLRDPQLAPLVAERVARLAPEMTTSDLVLVADGFARQQFKDERFWRTLTTTVFARPLTLGESASFLRALSGVGIADFSASEIVSVQVRDALVLGRGYSPGLLTEICQIFAQAGIRDYALTEAVLAHAVKFPFDFSPNDLCRLAEVAVGVSESDFRSQASVLLQHCDFTLVDAGDALVSAVRAARSLGDAEISTVGQATQRKFMKLPVSSQKPFELHVLVAAFAEAGLVDRKCVERISDHLKFQLEFCEAKELATMARVLGTLPEESKASRKFLLVRTLGVWCAKRKDELLQCGLWPHTQTLLKSI